MPGIRRLRVGTGFSYTTPSGQTLRDRSELARIRSLAIPPAWTDVWICPIANGHLQGTGRDARGRKQYRYHPRWSVVRGETKYGRMLAFASALPKIRQRVEEDLRGPGLTRTKLLAMVVRLLETTFIRIGNEQYARENGSFGLTTLQGRHIAVNGATIRFRFRGKSGKIGEVEITDRRLAGLVRRCRDLPGKELLQYIDEDGQPQPIDSADVNEYLQSISGDEFTAKDFRTWAGTLLAARCLAQSELAPSATARRSAVVATARAVAGSLGNTPAICRKAYIHPAILAGHQDEKTFDRWRKSAIGGARAGLSDEESRLLRFLEAGSSQ
jgi:DNA topoisomerase-1